MSTPVLTDPCSCAIESHGRELRNSHVMGVIVDFVRLQYYILLTNADCAAVVLRELDRRGRARVRKAGPSLARPHAE